MYIAATCYFMKFHTSLLFVILLHVRADTEESEKQAPFRHVPYKTLVVVRLVTPKRPITHNGLKEHRWKVREYTTITSVYNTVAGREPR